MNRCTFDAYPDQPGTYFAQNGRLVCIVQMVGWYPNIKPKNALILNNFINLNMFDEDDELVKKYLSKKNLVADKDLINSIEFDRDCWKFSRLPFDETDFNTCEFTYDGVLSLNDYEKTGLFSTYMRMMYAGVPFTKMLSLIKIRTNCTTQSAINLINEFDKLAHRNASHNRV